MTLREQNGNGQKVGYIRVSSVDQNTERQLDGLSLDYVFEDKCSGKDTKRPQLQECLRYVRKGDTLHVHSIDRLARNLQDLLSILENLKTRGVAVTFHKEHLTFTGEANPFQDLQLQIIGAVAQFERSMIRERQREGIRAAQKQGKHLGRPRVLEGKRLEEAKARVASGESVSMVAKDFGVSRNTFYRAIK